MRWIEHVQTMDGKLHRDYLEAKKYTEKQYADKLLKLAHEIAKLEKYAVIAEWLDSNLGEFIALQELKKDIILEKKGDFYGND